MSFRDEPMHWAIRAAWCASNAATLITGAAELEARGGSVKDRRTLLRQAAQMAAAASRMAAGLASPQGKPPGRMPRLRLIRGGRS